MADQLRLEYLITAAEAEQRAQSILMKMTGRFCGDVELVTSTRRTTTVWPNPAYL